MINDHILLLAYNDKISFYFENKLVYRLKSYCLIVQIEFKIWIVFFSIFDLLGLLYEKKKSLW